MSSSSLDEFVSMHETYASMAREIDSLRKRLGRQVLIAIAGPPGAGKTTTARALVSLVPKSVLLPMDGYHFTKERLNAFPDPVEAFKRRGAHWTFDAERFVRDVAKLKACSEGSFPSFDHGVGDPVEDDIHITTDHEVVIVEGNYLLQDIEPWSALKALFDYSFFIDAPIEVVEKRVLSRHISVGRTESQAAERVATNDALNAREILLCKGRADRIVASS